MLLFRKTTDESVIFSVSGEDVGKYMMYVSRKLASSAIHCVDNVLLGKGCDNFLNHHLFNSMYFIENSEIIVVHSVKFSLCNACGTVGHY